MTELITVLEDHGFEIGLQDHKESLNRLYTHVGFQGSVETKPGPVGYLLVNIYGSVERESIEFIIKESTLNAYPRPLIEGMFIPMILWLNKVIG
jgi:hypothetical protein